jgi:hypothetical protein
MDVAKWFLVLGAANGFAARMSESKHLIHQGGCAWIP